MPQKVHVGVDVYFHISLTSTLEGDEGHFKGPIALIPGKEGPVFI